MTQDRILEIGVRRFRAGLGERVVRGDEQIHQLANLASVVFPDPRSIRVPLTIRRERHVRLAAEFVAWVHPTPGFA